VLCCALLFNCFHFVTFLKIRVSICKYWFFHEEQNFR